jgi:hypothetical protein
MERADGTNPVTPLLSNKREAVQPNWAERRRHVRVNVDVPATLFLPKVAHEIPASVIDLSPGGAQLRSDAEVPAETLLVLYIEGFGRFEGQVAWIADRKVGIRFTASVRKEERVAHQLRRLEDIHAKEVGTTLAESGTTLRRHERYSVDEPCQFTREDGSVVSCNVLNLSISGASLKTEARPKLGEIVLIGKMSARVARYHEEGIGVEFVSRPA